MSADEVAEMLKLPADERLRIVELLWESLSAVPDAVPVGEAHRVSLDEALEEYRRDPNDVLTLEQVFSEVRRAR